MKLALVALVAVRLVAAGDLASDFFPPNTKVVFGVRVPAIVESALFKDTGTGAQQFSRGLAEGGGDHRIRPAARYR